MIKLTLLPNLRIQIDTDDYDYLRDIKEYFSEYVEGFQFMPAWKAGQWDGKTTLFASSSRSIPYGILTHYLRYHKRTWPEKKISASKEIKELFKGTKIKPKYDLNLQPYDYQQDCIEAALEYSKCIIRSATASGKCTKDLEIEIEIDDDVFLQFFSDIGEECII